MASLKCKRCNWVGDIHSVDGITLSAKHELDLACESKGHAKLDSHNGLCPMCTSIRIVKI
jgi:hypothetical protein